MTEIKQAWLEIFREAAELAERKSEGAIDMAFEFMAPHITDLHQWRRVLIQAKIDGMDASKVTWMEERYLNAKPIAQAGHDTSAGMFVSESLRARFLERYRELTERVRKDDSLVSKLPKEVLDVSTDNVLTFGVYLDRLYAEWMAATKRDEWGLTDEDMENARDRIRSLIREIETRSKLGYLDRKRFKVGLGADDITLYQRA